MPLSEPVVAIKNIYRRLGKIKLKERTEGEDKGTEGKEKGRLGEVWGKRQLAHVSKRAWLWVLENT